MLIHPDCRGMHRTCVHAPGVTAAALGQYSGAGRGAPLPMLLSMRAEAIDRGACIKDLSQYPAEVRPSR